MRERIFKSILIFVNSIFMVGFSLFPFVYMLLVSLSQQADFLSPLTSFEFTLLNYQTVLKSESLHFLNYLLNSLIISSISAFFTVVIATLAAFSFTRLNFPYKSHILFFILAVSLFPQISLVGYLFKFMTRLGWINTYQALILPYISWILPLAVWILTSYFSQIPRDLDKQALIDGANLWQILRRVMVPVVSPGIFSVFLLSFIFAFNEFMFALMLTADYKARTIPVGIALFQGLYGQIPWGNIMAASAVSILPLVIIATVFQRHIIGGLTRGALKG